MKLHLLALSLTLLPLTAQFSARAHTPFLVVTEKGEQGSSSAQNVLWKDEQIEILRTDSAVETDFRNLYAVRMPFNVSREALSILTRVLYFKNGLAVVRTEVENVTALSQLLHGAGMPCGAIIRLDGSPMTLETISTANPKIPISGVNAEVDALLRQVSEEKLRFNVEAMSSIPTRYHESPTNINVVEMLLTSYSNVANGRSDVTVAQYNHGAEETPQPSVVVRIEGRDSPEEIVVLGSHIDSVNWSDGATKPAPGVDDNASGTSTNMEVFRVLMENNIIPSRTIEIHGYAAEEIGLVGSNDMAKRYKAEGKNVISMLQNDMNLYKRGNDALKVWFIQNNTDDGLNELLGKIVTSYLNLPWQKKRLFGGDSDHTSWRRQGFSTAFPFENPGAYNTKIHTKNDTLDVSRAFDQALVYTQLSLAYTLHFAGIAR